MRKTSIKLSTTAKPFVKWAGGKSQLLDQFEDLFPKTFNNYIEPLVGGGAVFFHLFNTTRIKNKAILNDVNPELMNCYRVIKNKVEELIEKLKELEYRYRKAPKKIYYRVRKWDRQKNFSKRSLVERAARTIFLNKTCYNGLYRVNNKGQFNVPFGRYKKPTICDEENLREVNVALQKAQLKSKDFTICLRCAKQGDFIYFDPPYYPISETADFTSYTKEDFTEKDQKRLKEVFKNLTGRKCKAMLSNSNTNFIRNLYKKFQIYEVKAKRYINSNPQGRGKIVELVIINYQP